MSRMRHASASREKHGSSSLPPGQEPVNFVEVAKVWPMSVNESSVLHSPSLKGKWQPFGIVSKLAKLHSVATLSEQSVFA